MSDLENMKIWVLAGLLSSDHLSDWPKKLQEVCNSDDMEALKASYPEEVAKAVAGRLAGY